MEARGCEPLPPVSRDGRGWNLVEPELFAVERYAGVRLRKQEVGDGTFLVLAEGRVAHRERFRPDHSYRDPIALPAVRAPGEGISCLERLAVLAAAA